MIQSSYVCFLVMFVIGRRGCGGDKKKEGGRGGGGAEKEGGGGIEKRLQRKRGRI